MAKAIQPFLLIPTRLLVKQIQNLFLTQIVPILVSPGHSKKGALPDIGAIDVICGILDPADHILIEGLFHHVQTP